MKLSVLRAIGMFLLAYIAITWVAFGTYLLAAVLMGQSVGQALAANSAETGFSLREVTGYAEAQRFFPIENLIIWTLFAVWYFKGKHLSKAKDAWPLALFWAGAAIFIDFLTAVALPLLLGHPKWLEWYTVSPYSFYVDQAPWIYLIYAAIFAAPFVYYWIRRPKQS